MFADSLLDSSWPSRSRRLRATLTSFGLQLLGIACLLALPLIFTEAVPQLQSMARLVTPSSAPPPMRSPAAPRMQQQSATVVVASQTVHLLQPPSRTPNVILPGDPIPSMDPVHLDNLPLGEAGPYRGNGVSGGTGWGFAINVPPPPKPITQKAARISTMMEGSLIYRVEPPYPVLAKTAGVQGPVELAAVINREGRITNLQVLSGHPLLVGAAIHAVNQWRYRPYILNGEPVEVDTKIVVNFILSR